MSSKLKQTKKVLADAKRKRVLSENARDSAKAFESGMKVIKDGKATGHKSFSSPGGRSGKLMATFPRTK
jgi:hypothetical protein